ncbi:cyclase family protein [Candidatus Gracilibacteria bacterium]|nr:cyclase family protein [Candidatus Gracilibacteria bacterium]
MTLSNSRNIQDALGGLEGGAGEQLLAQKLIADAPGDLELTTAQEMAMLADVYNFGQILDSSPGQEALILPIFAVTILRLLRNSREQLEACLGNYKIIDVSMYLDGFTFADDQGVEVTGPFNRVPGETPEFVYDINLCSQSATHIQGPHYFLKDGRAIDTFPIERFESKALVVDMPKRGEDMTRAELEELVGDADLEGKAVIFRSGHMQELIDGMPLESNTRPGLSMEGAKYLVEEKGVKMVAIDSVGVESRVSPNYEVNVYLCENEIMILEGLVNLEEIKKDWVLIEAFPLKLAKVEGTPCRAIVKEAVG